MTGINNATRSDLQFLRRNVQNGLGATTLLPLVSFFSIPFLSPLTNPPRRRATEDCDVCYRFIWSPRIRGGREES